MTCVTAVEKILLGFLGHTSAWCMKYSFPEKKLLVQKQAFLSSSAMLEFMLSGNINLLVVSMPKLLSFYQDVSTYGAKTTEVPFRAGNPIISTGLRPFMGGIILQLFCLFASIWSRLNPILVLLHFKWIILFQAFCRQLKNIQYFKRTLTFDRNYTDLHMTILETLKIVIPLKKKWSKVVLFFFFIFSKAEVNIHTFSHDLCNHLFLSQATCLLFYFE